MSYWLLAVGVGSTTTELKWRIWNGPETSSDRTTSQFSLDVARLSDDGKSVTIMETGLYFIYAQVYVLLLKQFHDPFHTYATCT